MRNRNWPERIGDETLAEYCKRNNIDIDDLVVVDRDRYTYEVCYAGYGWHGREKDE
jgi:hypothetical protein